MQLLQMRNLLLIISVLLVYLTLPASAQTNFFASVEEGCDSLTVEFNYTTNIAVVTSVKWTFGDGTESTEESPVYKYEEAGNYLVSVVINGTDSVAKADFIRIGKTPEVDFAYRDTLETGSFNISFTAPSQDESYAPYTYDWELSDGTTASTPNFIHQFDTVGIYTAQLTVIDGQGCDSQIEKTIEVKTQLIVPTVFTPNNDSFNNLLIINGDGRSTYFIQIFSRSGIKVFERKAKVLVWDGRMFSGETVRDGIYYYVITSVDGPSLKQTGFLYVFTGLPEDPSN